MQTTGATTPHANRSRRQIGWRLSNWLDRRQPPETVVLMGTALLVGLGTGLAAIVFRWLIGLVAALFYGGPGLLGDYALVVAPALGGLLVGLLIHFTTREARGSGIPEVMEAVALEGGRIPPLVIPVKALASALTIGSGGSAGREGPIVQIGSALGSALGQGLRLSDERVRNLVACGAAGGIAATFNTPIAGVIFAMEVILGELNIRHFTTVVVSAVTAAVVGRIAFGDMPAFTVPDYALTSPWELLLYTVLGLLAAVLAVAFARILYRTADLFDAATWLPAPLKPALGGLLLGVGGLLFVNAASGLDLDAFGQPIPFFGVGYKAIEWALFGHGAVPLLLALAGIKVLSTSLTLGSGGSGGVFAPALFIGAMFGGAFGQIVHALFPGVAANPGAYALVGMAAVFAGATRAPITAILALFEMTDDYRIILPLMLASVVSVVLAEQLSRESIYTLKLVRRGVHLDRGRDIDVMHGVLVGEVMSTHVAAAPLDLGLEALDRRLDETGEHGVPVVDGEGKLCGVVTRLDLARARQQGGWPGRTVQDIASRAVLTAYPDEAMWIAIRRMDTRGVGQLPVVDRRDPGRILGLIRRADIVRAYRVGLGRRLELRERAVRLEKDRLANSAFVELDVAPDSALIGQLVRDLALPAGCLLSTVRRGDRVLLVNEDTEIQPGDRLAAFAEPARVVELYRAVQIMPPEI